MQSAAVAFAESPLQDRARSGANPHVQHRLTQLVWSFCSLNMSQLWPWHAWKFNLSGGCETHKKSCLVCEKKFLVCTNSGLRHVTLCIPYAGGSADAHRERQFAKGHSGLSEDWSVLASCHVTLWLIEIGVCPANTLKLPGKPGPFKRGLLLFAKGFSEASSLAELGDLSVLTETYWFEASAWKHRHCLNLPKFDLKKG